MKNLIFLILLLALICGCKQEPCFDDSGTIIGFDARKCMCCGGWFIQIENDTLRFDQLPEGTDVILENPIYPIEVRLDWHPKDPQCLGDEIIVTRMECKK